MNNKIKAKEIDTNGTKIKPLAINKHKIKNKVNLSLPIALIIFVAEKPVLSNSSNSPFKYALKDLILLISFTA